MFFFGVFGSGAKAVPAGYLHVSCPLCGDAGPLHLAHRYQYLHAFFIPLFRFHSQFFATCRACASVFEAEPDLGREAKRTGDAEATQQQLHVVQDNRRRVCPNCGAPIDAADSFCRRCGGPL